jgi:hypothetical protein
MVEFRGKSIMTAIAIVNDKPAVCNIFRFDLRREGKIPFA